MTAVNYDEVIRWLEYKSSINKLELKDIEWMRDDGTKIEFDPRLIERFNFIGLNNINFAELFLTRVLAGEQGELLKELHWDEDKHLKIVALRSSKIN